MFGGYYVFNAGLIWFLLWTMAAGFSKSLAMLTVCRAMEGLGLAAFLPAGISLLGRIYRPGPRKNMVFGLYGAIGPIGFFSGIIVAGIAQEVLTWRWYYWLGSILGTACAVGTIFSAPNDYQQVKADGVKMDWWGACTTIPGLMLVIYAISNTSSAPGGWASPQIIVTLVVGVLFLAAAIYVEGWVAEAPLLPAEIFRVKYMKRMLSCLFMTWGAFYIFLFYSQYYFQRVADKTPLESAIYFGPWAIGGVLFALFSGLMLHVIPGRILLLISGISKAVALLFFALMPEHPNYWAWILPAMIFETACVDIIWTVSNVYLTTSLPKQQQGLAGALINFTLFIGSAFFVGIADIAASELKKTSMSLKDLYQYIFWLGFGVACIAMVVSLFIKLDKAGSRLTVEEEAQLSRPHSDSIHSCATLNNNATPTHDNEESTSYSVSSKEVQGKDHEDLSPATPESGGTAAMDWEEVEEMGMAEKVANMEVCGILDEQKYMQRDGEARDME
ncbi:hypothetical protein NLU13_0885 [Sarocladium strictum]|nr:hypothetical protein NLU13_0885 [Sarocladium strictum]